MFCTACGFELREADRFCAQCGKGTGRGAASQAPFAGSQRRLVRPLYDKNIAGVCSGFARYLEVDVVLIRLIWLTAAIFTGGAGFIAYLIAWIVMPKEYAPPASAPAAAPAPASV